MSSDSGMPTALPEQVLGGMTMVQVKRVNDPDGLGRFIAQNIPPHIPYSGVFQVPPTNLGRVVTGSASVRINGRTAARADDQCETCHDLPSVGPQAPSPRVVVTGLPNVFIG